MLTPSFIHNIFFLLSLFHENFWRAHVGSRCLLPSLTAESIHWRLRLSSVFQQHFKAASRSPVWEGTFMVRSKTVHSPETEPQSQVSAFAVTQATTPQRSNPLNDAPAPLNNANMPTLRHSYTLTLTDNLPQHKTDAQRKNPQHKLVSSLMSLIINPVKVSPSRLLCPLSCEGSHSDHRAN